MKRRRRPSLARILRRVVMACLPLAFASTAGAGYEEGVAALEARDAPAAIAQFEAGIAAGDMASANALGEVFFFGVGVEPELERACDLFESAAHTGHMVAQHNIATCYFQGAGRPRDYEQSLYWYQLAANQGSLKSMCAAGNQYEAGLGVARDKALGSSLCLRAATAGDADAQADMGERYLKTEDYAGAVEWLARAAAQDHPRAATILGLMYDRGMGVEADSERAFHWLERAARAGNDRAFAFLGGLSMKAATGPEDREKVEDALVWYVLAAAYHPDAETRLATQGLVDDLAALAPELVPAAEARVEAWKAQRPAF